MQDSTGREVAFFQINLRTFMILVFVLAIFLGVSMNWPWEASIHLSDENIVCAISPVYGWPLPARAELRGMGTSHTTWFPWNAVGNVVLGMFFIAGSYLLLRLIYIYRGKLGQLVALRRLSLGLLFFGLAATYVLNNYEYAGGISANWTYSGTVRGFPLPAFARGLSMSDSTYNAMPDKPWAISAWDFHENLSGGAWFPIAAGINWCFALAVIVAGVIFVERRMRRRQQ